MTTSLLIILGVLVVSGASVGAYFWWQRVQEAREKAEWAAMPVQKLDEVAPPKKQSSMDFPDIEPDRDQHI